MKFTEYNLRTKVLGTEISFPAFLAPVGYSRVMHPGGEIVAAAAAGNAGTGYTLSTISGHKLENVRAATKGPAWFQLYLVGGREVAEAGIERARNAGFNALVVTIDTPVAGMRERDFRNGMMEMFAGSLFATLSERAAERIFGIPLAELSADGQRDASGRYRKVFQRFTSGFYQRLGRTAKTATTEQVAKRADELLDDVSELIDYVGKTK